MKHQKTICGAAAALGMLVLILDSSTALEGAAQGLELCIRTIIPSLFPFFVVSILMTHSLSGMKLSVLRPLGSLCKIPEGSEVILLSGFLGGYPVGAQAVGDSYASGRLSRSQAGRMLFFCSNAGPSFLFGIIAPQFSEIWYAWAIWAIHILSALAVAAVLPGCGESAVRLPEQKPVTPSAILSKALQVTGAVCGWVIIFRVIGSFLDRWIFWAFSSSLQVLLMGLLELANGCCCLQTVQPIGLRFVFAVLLLSFGGFCVTLQTASVIGDLPLRFYLSGKLLQTVFSLLPALVLQSLFPPADRMPGWNYMTGILLSGMLIYGFYKVKLKNNSRNPMTVGV